MSEEHGTMVDKSESSSFEDLASAAAEEIEEAKLAEALAAEKEKSQETKADEWQDVLGSGSLLKKVSHCKTSLCSYNQTTISPLILSV